MKERASFGWAIRQAAAILLAVSLAMPLAQAQQQPQPGETPQSKTKSGGSATARTPDIISDNLDRVAASADQISRAPPLRFARSRHGHAPAAAVRVPRTSNKS